MFNSTVLEVAIGLIFCFASVALITSSVYEAIASVLKLRSNTLLNGISDLLNAKTSEGQELLLAIYNNAVAHPTGTGVAATLKDIKNKPSYIHSRNFALALIQGIQKAPGKFADLGAAIEKMGDPQLKNLLLAFYNKAEGDAEKFHREVASWFDSGMACVSCVYKRQTQLWCFVIALVIAVMFNIDSVQLFKTLWLHPVSLAQLNVEVAQSASATESLKQLQQLPIGWNSNFHWSALTNLSSIVGWIVTASASLFGAPFWFDLLKNIVRLRGTGNKPDEITYQKDVAVSPGSQ